MSIFNKKSLKKNTEAQLMQKVEQLVNEDPNLKYNGFFKDKEGNSVALFSKQSDSQIEISLLDPYARISVLQASFQENQAQLLKLSVASCNKGYGSLLMREFLYQCKMHSAKIGDSFMDPIKVKNEDKQRAVHFFSKYGFEIHFNSKDSQAVIHFKPE